MSYGRIAYDAYRTRTGGKSLASGQPIPEWPNLSGEIRDAWEAAGTALVGRRWKVYRMVQQLRAIVDADDAFFRCLAPTPEFSLAWFEACVQARRNGIEGLFHSPFDDSPASATWATGDTPADLIHADALAADLAGFRARITELECQLSRVQLAADQCGAMVDAMVELLQWCNIGTTAGYVLRGVGQGELATLLFQAADQARAKPTTTLAAQATDRNA